MADFDYISGDPDNLTGGGAANMVDIQGPLIDLKEWLNTDLQPRVAVAVPTFVTALPVTATDGQEIYYLADDANGVVWHLRYRATSASVYKWEFIGGRPLMATVATAETMSGASFVNLATIGPDVTVPLVGDYDYDFEASGFPTTAGVSNVFVGLNVGGVTPTSADYAIHTAAAANYQITLHRFNRKTITTLAASGGLMRMQYATQAGITAQFYDRRLAVRPVRVG